MGRDPQKWKIDYFPLIADRVHAYPYATTVVDGDKADIFALDEQRSKSLLATRIPLSGPSDPQANLEYLAANGNWAKGSGSDCLYRRVDGIGSLAAPFSIFK
jgi:hypothetical protein